MNYEIEPVDKERKEVLRNLMELYLYDFSEFEGTDVNNMGLYGYDYLDYYWKENGRHSFFIKYNDKLAGFVMIRKEDEHTNSIAEFFIMRKYRKQGLGAEVAANIFQKFKGHWKVRYLEKNESAKRFWEKIVSDYTNGNFQSDTEKGWNGTVLKF